jgi:hypothetical protein
VTATTEPSARPSATRPSATRPASRRRLTAPAGFTEEDLKVRRVAYDRVIRPNWSEPGQHGLNLARELADCRSRPDLLDESDHRFVRYVESKGVRGHEEAWLSAVHTGRLAGIVRRYIDPVAELLWRKRQAAKKCEAGRDATATFEAVDAAGRWTLPTRVM